MFPVSYFLILVARLLFLIKPCDPQIGSGRRDLVIVALTDPESAIFGSVAAEIEACAADDLNVLEQVPDDPGLNETGTVVEVQDEAGFDTEQGMEFHVELACQVVPAFG